MWSFKKYSSIIVINSLLKLHYGMKPLFKTNYAHYQLTISKQSRPIFFDKTILEEYEAPYLFLIYPYTSWLEESTPAKGFPMIQCSCGFFSNSCPLNLLLVQSLQAEIIIVKRLIQGHNNVTRVQVEPISFDQSHRKNYAVTLSAPLPTKWRNEPVAIAFVSQKKATHL